MTDSKTIAQIAAELGVSRQAVYKKLKNNPDLTTSLQPYVTTKGKLTVYSLQGQELIKQSFSNLSVNQTDNQSVNHDNQMLTSLQQQNSLLQSQITDKDNQINLLKSELDVLKAENNSLRDKIADRDKTIDSLQAQLTDKDNEISLLHSQLADRDKTIDLLQSQISDFKADKQYLKDKLDDITTALTAAQALHGIEKKQTVIEVKEQANDSEPAETPTPQEPQQKLSFFARLFRKRSE